MQLHRSGGSAMNGEAFSALLARANAAPPTDHLEQGEGIRAMLDQQLGGMTAEWRGALKEVIEENKRCVALPAHFLHSRVVRGSWDLRVVSA